MNSYRTRKLTYSAMLLALAILMPRVAGLIPDIGRTLNLMHIPVLLCGFLCGWPWGLAVGGMAPLLSSALNSMPKIYPDAVVMAFELATYGAIAGLVYGKLAQKKGAGKVYIALIAAMIAGRIVYGLVYLCLLKLGLAEIGHAFLTFVWMKAFVTPFPGIVLQIILIPVLVIALDRAGLMLNRKK